MSLLPRHGRCYSCGYDHGDGLLSPSMERVMKANHEDTTLKLLSLHTALGNVLDLINNPATSVSDDSLKKLLETLEVVTSVYDRYSYVVEDAKKIENEAGRLFIKSHHLTKVSK